jgi:hypothetical protein
MLTQAADGFELEAPLQSLEGFLDTSAAVVQRNESHAKEKQSTHVHHSPG